MTLTELHLNPRRTETAGAAWAQFPGLSDCGAGVAAHLSYLSFPSSLVCICLFIYLLIFENTVFKSHHRAPCVGGSNMGMHHLSSSNQVRVSVGQVPSEGPREKSGPPPPPFLVPGGPWQPLASLACRKHPPDLCLHLHMVLCPCGCLCPNLPFFFVFGSQDFELRALPLLGALPLEPYL
jgi:hypothetical protein